MAPLTSFLSKPADLLSKRDAEEGGASTTLGRSASPRRKSKRVKTEEPQLNLHLKQLVYLSDDEEGEKCGTSNVPPPEIHFVDLSDDEEEEKGGTCNVPSPKIHFVDLSDDEEGKKCEICNWPPPEIHFVTLCDCRHAFCSGCIKDHYDSVIDSQMSKVELTAEDVLQKLPCPNERCNEEVKRIELVNIVGLLSVLKYEVWLNAVFDVFYGPSVKEARMDCSKAQAAHKNQILPVILSGRGRSKVPDARLGEQRYKIYNCLVVLEEALGDFTQEKQNPSKKGKCLVEEEASGDFAQAKQNPSKKGKRLVELEEIIGEFPQAMQNPSKKGKYVVDPRLEDASEGFEFTQAMQNSKLQTIEVPHYFTTVVPPIHTAGGSPIYPAGFPPIYTAGLSPLSTAGVPPIYNAGVPPIFNAGTSPFDTAGFSDYTTWLNKVGFGGKPFEEKVVWAGGTGFGGNPSENKKAMDTNLAAAKRAELEFDRKVEKQLALLTTVLSGNADGKRKKQPALTVATFALIMRDNILSRLLQQLAQNDSMMDISDRSSLYQTVVSLVGAMELHTELLPVLIGHTSQVPPNKGKAHVPLQEIAEDKGSTIFEKLGNIYRQAKVMLQNMAQPEPQPEPDRGRKRKLKTEAESNLAEELCRCYESLERAASMHSSRVVAQGRGSASRSRRTVAEAEASPIESTSSESPAAELSVVNYKKALKQVQFRQLPMTNRNGGYAHFYSNDISGNVSSSAIIDKGGLHNKKRINHIAKEVACLATNLPLEWESSIHLCVDLNRIDVMRALIIGPQGTPYQNGLFLFDIFLPPDYPMSPPRVHFLTTGGRKVRFNPNLYNTGQVCLSLLGTWAGPGWVGGKSTLLQVLVSIQSLIFVKDPYYNEPGREHHASSTACFQAEKENSRLRRHTLSIAVLAALKKPDPLFAELAREHFRFKRKEVEEQCDEWMAAEANHAKREIVNIVQDVKQELRKLYS